MITPITLVHTYVELPIVGANIRAATSSYAISANPVTKAITSNRPIRFIEFSVAWQRE